MKRVSEKKSEAILIAKGRIDKKCSMGEAKRNTLSSTTMRLSLIPILHKLLEVGWVERSETHLNSYSDPKWFVDFKNPIS